MAEVLTIIQEKGGVGKSIITMNIAYYFSMKQKKVLVIDLDGQAADITYYLKGNIPADLPTIIDVFCEKIRIEDTIIKISENLDLIPANVHVANLAPSNKITVFKRNIKPLKSIYDYILIDVTPSPTWAHMLALSSTNQKVIPVLNSDAASLKAMISLNMSVEEVRETVNPTIEYLGIIINKYDGRTTISKEVVRQAEQIAESIGTSLFETKLRQSVVLSEQPASHKSVFEYARNSPIAKDFQKLGGEIEARLKNQEE